MNLVCPRCHYTLNTEVVDEIEVDHCQRCNGSFLDSGKESALLGKAASPEFWQHSSISRKLRRRALQCPKDHNALEAFNVVYGEYDIEIDICPACQGMWLDPHEGKMLRLAVLDAGQDAQLKLAEHPGFRSYIFQVFSGLPVEAWNPVHHRPIVTLSLMLILALLFALQLSSGHELTFLLAVVPQQLLTGTSLWTLFSYGFVHANFIHLLGNLYFLYIFGDNIEDHVGRKVFVTLYVASLIAGALATIALDPTSNTPMLGASGAVAGLMGAYLILFPRIKVYLTILFIPIRLNAIWYLAVWAAYNGMMSYLGVEGVAWIAHLAGFLTGVLLASYAKPIRSLKERITRGL